jgi:hypothetical protein
MRLDLLESRPDPLPAGVVATPSRGAKQLERSLGIAYNTVPLEVSMHIANRIALFLGDSDVRKDFRPIFLLGPRTGSAYPKAFYSPRWHTLFMRGYHHYRGDEDFLRCYYHENAHGFMYQPGTVLRSEFGDGWRDRIGGSASDIERYMVHKLYAEGFAQWVADKVLERDRLFVAPSDGSPSSYEPKRAEKVLNGNEPYKESFNKSMPQLVRAIKCYKQILEEPKDMSLRLKALNTELSNFYYDYGRNFVETIMANLMLEGVALPEAVKRILTVYPINLDQARDPVRFAQKLLSA